MEHPRDPFHVRPFPQQPHRGGKALTITLKDLETTLGELAPDLERIRSIQARLHDSANLFNDDQLIDRIRRVSNQLEQYRAAPSKELMREILTEVLKIRVDLKHL